MHAVILLPFLFPVGHPDDAIPREVQFGIRGEHGGRVCLTFRNMTQKLVTLQVPSEGSGICDRYFVLEAVGHQGRKIRRGCKYAPGIPEYQVILRHRSIYEHRINPHAYLDVDENVDIRWLRVTYVNPLTKTSHRSNWLELNKQRATSRPSPLPVQPSSVSGSTE